MLHTRSCLLTPHQQHQILDLFASDFLVALEVTWSVYQNIIDACRAPDTSGGRSLMQAEINTLTSTRILSYLTKLITLGRTLKRRAGNILANFNHPAPQAALLKLSTAASSAYAAPPRDFRNLTHYIARALLETGGFKPQLHSQF